MDYSIFSGNMFDIEVLFSWRAFISTDPSCA